MMMTIFIFSHQVHQQQISTRLVASTPVPFLLSHSCCPIPAVPFHHLCHLSSLKHQVEKSDSWVCVGGGDREVVSSEKIDTAAEHRSDVMPHPPSDGLGIVQKEPLVAAKQAWSNGGVAEGPQRHHHEEHESGGHRGSPEVQRSGSGQVRHQGVHEVHKDIQRVPPSEGMLVEDIEECLNESLTGTRGGRPQDVCVSPEPAQVEVHVCPNLSNCCVCVCVCVCDVYFCLCVGNVFYTYPCLSMYVHV